MTDEDRKAIREAYTNACKQYDISTELTKTGDWVDERAEIVATAANIVWLAALDHYREQVRELVEAVECFVGVHCGCGDQPYHNKGAKMFVDANDLSIFAAKLKEQL